MGRRRIGQEKLGFAGTRGDRRSFLDDLEGLIDWAPVERRLAVIVCAAKGEPAWPPLAVLRALLIAVWYDLSDVKLAEALDDRASFRRFCGFSASEPTPERTAFVRFRKVLIAIRMVGARLFFLPKYSPDLNPIEQAFAKLKHWLRKAAARSFDTVCSAIGNILARFTPQECASYFKNAGYERK